MEIIIRTGEQDPGPRHSIAGSLKMLTNLKSLKMKRLFFTILILVFASQLYAQDTKVTSDNKPIYRVLNTFMESIIKKDTVTFLSLFANGPVAWVSVQSKDNFELMRKDDPAAKLIRYGDHTEFIRFIATEGSKEEKFYNVRITKDDYLASASFDYSFWKNGKKANWGKENWVLMFDGIDWKIAGVYWSSTSEKIKKEPVSRYSRTNYSEPIN